MTLRQEVVETDVLALEETDLLDVAAIDVPNIEGSDGAVAEEVDEPNVVATDVLTAEEVDVPKVEEPDELKVKGAMLVKVRGMTPDERAAEGWEKHPDDIPCVEYDNGAILYSACEKCDEPGTIYASYAGGRWGIDSTGEPYQRTPTRKVIPKWVYPAVALAVLVAGLAAAGVVMLWNVNEDQRSQVGRQEQIIREQRTLMDRQTESQRSIERILRENQVQLEKSLRDFRGKVAGVAAQRDGLRDANAQLEESNAQLKQRVEQLRQE